MNRLMSSQEPGVILTLTDIRGSFSTFIHYLQRGFLKDCIVIVNKYTSLEIESSHFTAQASCERAAMPLPLPPEGAPLPQLTSTL